MTADVETELDRLFALPPSEFIAARNDLARRLKDDDAERADEVKRLRKPTSAVWLVNRLAREHELDVQRLAKTGEALMRGESYSKATFAEARHEEEETLRRLSQAARQIAERDGIGGAALERARQTLRAAALKDEARELLRRGRLTEELEPPGLEALQALARSAPGHTASSTRGRKTGRTKPQGREKVKALRAEERRLVTAAQEAERAATRAESEARNLRKKAEKAKAAATRAAEQAATADEEADR